MVTFTKLLAPFSESWQKRFQRLSSAPRTFEQYRRRVYFVCTLKALGPLSDRWIFNMPVREQRRPPASSPIYIHEYESSESSASPRNCLRWFPIWVQLQTRIYQMLLYLLQMILCKEPILLVIRSS